MACGGNCTTKCIYLLTILNYLRCFKFLVPIHSMYFCYCRFLEIWWHSYSTQADSFLLHSNRKIIYTYILCQLLFILILYIISGFNHCQTNKIYKVYATFIKHNKNGYVQIGAQPRTTQIHAPHLNILWKYEQSQFQPGSCMVMLSLIL